MKVSHEIPIALLKESLKFNDYQYCLVHLLEEQPEYLAHYEYCRDNNIEFILDNSIFELGESFDMEKFAYWVERLKPTYYIVPDVLEGKEETISKFREWNSKYNNLPGKKMGVVQGKTYEEIRDCYTELIDLGVDKIAISFDYSYYQDEYPYFEKLVAWKKGRQNLIKRLLKENVIDINKEHHLLGCGLASEFSFYNKYDFITTVDTSNPVVAGIKGLKYDGKKALCSKPSIKLFELIDYTPTKEQIKLIKYNAKQFKKICQTG